FIDHGPGGKFDVVDFPLTKFKSVFDAWDQAIGEEGWLNIYLDNHDFPRMVSRFGNDQEYHEESAKLLAMLTLTLRGTPCIYQGSEIGMTNVAFPSLDDYRDVETLNTYKNYQDEGKDLDELLKIVHIQGRDNVRTPFQWDASANGGFTDGEPWIKSNPNYTKINAQAEMSNPDSVWHFYKKLLAWRKDRPIFAYGSYQPLVQDSETLFAYLRADNQETYYVVLNFTDNLQEDVARPEGDWELVFGNYSDANEKLGPWEGRIYKKM
ncbi:MAG: alpha-amylase family glycosyl hydrolase, partial [Bacteroidota bacterium]